MTRTTSARLRPLTCMLLALAVADPSATADEPEQERRGLKRLLPAPFKKESAPPESDPAAEAAIEDMRAFTASLPHLDPAKPTAPRPAPSKPAALAGAPQPASGPVAAVDPPAHAGSAPGAPVPPAPKTERRGFFRLPFSSAPKPPASQPASPPIVAPGPHAGPAAAPPAPEPEKVSPPGEDHPAGRRKLIRLPFVSDGDAPAPVAVAEVPPAARKRSPLSLLPFVGDDGETAAQSAAAPTPAPDSEPDAAPPIAVSPPAVEGAPMPAPRPRFRLFGKDAAGGPEPDTAPEVAVADEPAASAPREKRGLWGLGRDKKEPEPEPVSTRDLGTGEKYIVTVSGTPFYSIGPSQPLPPDEILDKGKVVTMRKSGWGWSDIELPGGQMGVVATKNLRKATPTETGGSWASRRTGGSTRGLFKVLDFNPAPEPELPTDAGAVPLGAGLLPPLHDD